MQVSADGDRPFSLQVSEPMTFVPRPRSKHGRSLHDESDMSVVPADGGKEEQVLAVFNVLKPGIIYKPNSLPEFTWKQLDNILGRKGCSRS